MPISADNSLEKLAEIKRKNWWQGSLISGDDLLPYDDCGSCSEWWVIASQTCNLYNPNFSNIPYFEVVPAKEIEACEGDKIRGNNPRTLHVEAKSPDKTIFLELNIQDRKWFKREILADLSAPAFNIVDAKRDSDSDWFKKQWLDDFVCWLMRSYNRVTLPDQFNDALRTSKIDQAFKKLSKSNSDRLYGVYLSLSSGDDIDFDGPVGMMPPPYILSINLIVYQDVDPDELRAKLLEQLFESEINDPENKGKKVTRAELAKRNNVRIVEVGVEAKSVAEFTLLEHKEHVRYTVFDYLSDSTLEPD